MMKLPGPRIYSAILKRRIYREKVRCCQDPSRARALTTSASVASECQTQTALMEAFPKVMVKPQLLPVSVPSDQCQFILFDLETTGIAIDSDICQIAAMKADCDECAASEPAVWSTYLIPGRSIERRAHRANGLSIDDYHGHRCLFCHGKPVEAQQYKEGVQSFYSYLQKQSSPDKHTILVAYGSERLDAPVLINSLNRCGISRQELGTLITGFSDALKMIRKMRTDPSMLKDGLPPTEFSLSSIYYHLFNTELRGAHDAVTDTRALHCILFQSHLKISPTQLLSSSSTLGSVHEMVQYSTTALSNLHSMKGKLFNNQDGPKLFLTRNMAAEIAKSGVCYEDLESVYREYGASGITELLSGPCSDREVRVTSNKATIDAVIDHFQSSHDNSP